MAGLSQLIRKNAMFGSHYECLKPEHQRGPALPTLPRQRWTRAMVLHDNSCIHV